MALARPTLTTTTTTSAAQGSSNWLQSCLNNQLLSPQARTLQRAVAETERLADGEQLKALEESRNLLDHSLKVVLAARQRQQQKPTDADAKSLKSRLRNVSEKSCQTILHYQGVFDVLNEQAPEYSTAAWGAIKLICLVVVNKTKIEVKVNDELTKLVWAFRELEINAGASSGYEGLVAIVTEAYAGFLAFLTKVVKYIQHHKPTKWALALVKPWEVEFQPAVDKIHGDLEAARRMANALTNLTVKKIDVGVTEGFTRLDDKIEFFKAYSEQGWSRIEQRRDEDTQVIKDYLNIISGAMKMTQPSPQLPGHVQRLEILPDEGQSLYSSRERGEIEPLSDFIEKGNNNSDPLMCRLEGLFPEVSRIERDRQKLYSRILPRLEIDSAGSYNVTRHEGVLRWLSSNSSQLLWIDGFRDSNATAWTTNFSLEILKASENLPDEVSLVYLHVLSDDVIEALESGSSMPSVVLQCFITQFLHQCRRILSHSVCMKHNLTARDLKDAKDDVEKLTHILQTLKEVARPANCLIVVDNVERIASVSDPAQAAHDQDFVALLKLLKRISRDDSMCTKVLITCRTGSFEEILTKKISDPATHPERHKIARIPTQEVLYGTSISTHVARRFSADPNASANIERAVKALRLNNIEEILATETNIDSAIRSSSIDTDKGINEDEDDLNALISQFKGRNLINDLLGEEDGDESPKTNRRASLASITSYQNEIPSPTGEDDPAVKWILSKSQRTLSARDRHQWVQNLFGDDESDDESLQPGKKDKLDGPARKDSTASEDSLENFLSSTQPEAKEEVRESEPVKKNLFEGMGIDLDD